MRGKALAVAAVLMVGVAGCGSAQPHSTSDMRDAIRQSIDAQLTKLGQPAKEIACVDRNVEKMSERQLAERVMGTAVSGEKKTRAQVEGPLGRGCP